ncbi:hypothetical protein VKT23_014253 [Stygiomarasmius scandens]|uniref:Uncharacterized protein n=1 Tax=Marasmiellus scandens TaxID=2682957 RepID=A0ABR1J0X4_9AGAR
MLSQLERLPGVILEHIAFLAVSSALLSPPKTLLNLLLTSSTLYHTLSLSSAPHLYANIFRACFDLGAIRQQLSSSELTDSRLAVELVSRYRLLRRVRRHDLSRETLSIDYCTAMRMLLENGGLNAAHLSSVGFVKFVAAHIEHCLEDHLSNHYYELTADFDTKLALELLILIISRVDITGFSQEFREHLLLVSRPFILSVLQSLEQKSVVAKPPRVLSSSLPSHEENEIVIHQSTADSTQPSLFRIPCHDASAAIILTFVLKEMDVPQIPPHLPLDRTTAIATGRSGPTQQDYQVVANYQTPLFGDDHPLAQRIRDSTHSAKRGLGFHLYEDRNLLNPDVPGLELNVYAHTSLLYLLTGVWEGIYMISSTTQAKRSGSPTLSELASPATPDFLCRTPIQFSLSCYLCFEPQQDMENLAFAPDIADWEVAPSQITASEDCLTLSGRRLPYEKFLYDSNCEHQVSRHPSQATDCIIIGQTLEEHEQAWGAYRYAGRLSKNGKVVLKREPKNASDEGFGNWIFEGELRFGAALVGTWRSGEPGDCGVRGIFSLRKTEAETQQ